MAQLALEESTDMHKATRFFARVGLPVHLGQLSMSPDNLDELDILAEVTMTNPNAHHMPMKLSHSLIKQSILDAHHVGVKISDEVGIRLTGAFIIKFRQAARQLVARTLAGLSSALHNAPAEHFHRPPSWHHRLHESAKFHFQQVFRERHVNGNSVVQNRGPMLDIKIFHTLPVSHRINPADMVFHHSDRQRIA